MIATIGDWGIEVSQKGGDPGFIELVDDRTLLIPEYRGNQFALGLGNMLKDPRVGLALLRPAHSPILALTPNLFVLRQLRLLRAVEPFLMPLAADPNETIENAIALLLRLRQITSGDKIVVATDILAQDRLIDSVQLRTIR